MFYFHRIVFAKLIWYVLIILLFRLSQNLQNNFSYTCLVLVAHEVVTFWTIVCFNLKENFHRIKSCSFTSWWQKFSIFLRCKLKLVTTNQTHLYKLNEKLNYAIYRNLKSLAMKCHPWGTFYQLLLYHERFISSKVLCTFVLYLKICN